MTRVPRFSPGRTEDRFARHRLIPGWDQERLRAASFVVAGAGALGNEVLKNLALAGVGRVLIVDGDVVSPSNLTRSVLFRHVDTGRPKAEVAARAYRELFPEGRAEALVGDLHHALGAGRIAPTDGVLGCLDSLDARLGLSRLARRAAVPFWNGGLGVSAAEVTHFGARSGPCFGCTLDSRARERELARWSCQSGRPVGLPTGTVPTTTISASLGGALLVQEALASLCPAFAESALAPGEKIFVTAAPGGATRSRIAPHRDCPDCAEPPLPERRLEGVSERATPRALADALELPPADLELHLAGDLVVGWRCACPEPPLPRPIRRATRCPACGIVPDDYRTVASLAADGPFADLPLATLGIPAGGEILGFAEGEAFHVRLDAGPAAPHPRDPVPEESSR